MQIPSMTSSARASSAGGTVSPSVFVGRYLVTSLPSTMYNLWRTAAAIAHRRQRNIHLFSEGGAVAADTPSSTGPR
jgi:hypothetical protein